MRDGDVVASRFVLEQLTGSGGLGDVYRAVDRQTGTPVAGKILHARSDLDAQRFTREAHVLMDLRHPRIVRYVAHGTTADGGRYLALEWLEGEDLGKRLARGPLTLNESVAVALRAAEGLAYA